MKGFVGLLLGLVFLASCSRNVHTDRASDVDFKGYKTYAWLPDEPVKDSAGNDAKNPYQNNIIRENLRSDVNAELRERGYTLDTQNPDFLVKLSTFTEKRSETVGYPAYGGGGFYGGYYWGGGYYGHPGFGFSPFAYNYPYAYNYYNYEYLEGTIVVDVIDPRSNKLVWRGWTDETETKPKKLQKEFKEDVAKIFDEFPVERRN